MTTILVAILSLGGFLFLKHPFPFPPISQASLVVKHIVPGETMHVHGSNFPPGSSVKITVDENTAASYTFALVSVGDSTLPKNLLSPADAIVTVHSDGTFDATLPVPTSWTPGSLHTIRATTQNAQTSAQASTDVDTEVSGKPTPTPEPPKSHHAPTLAGISPASGPTTGGTTVIVNGSNFTNAIGIFFGSTSGIDARVLSDSQISVTSPAGSGTVNLRVITPYGTSKVSSSDRFTYTASSGPPPLLVQKPVVAGLNPTHGSSDGGTSVTITGSNFKDATGVSFGSMAAARFKVVSDTQIAAVSPAGNGAVNVTVTTPNGTSKTSDQFTYVVPPPVVTRISPASGSAAGGDTVIITGTDFTAATSVAFGIATVPCNIGNKCVVDSNTQITVTSPPQDPSDTSNPVDVTVKTSAGTSATSGADQFTYTVPPPTVTGISSTRGSAKGGDPVTITGTNFTHVTSVAFGKRTFTCGTASSDNLLKSWYWIQNVFNAYFKYSYNPLDKNSQSNGGSCTVDSDTQISVISPAEDPSESSDLVDVTVKTSDGTSATSSADQFTYLPVVDSISPVSGPVTEGTSVTINGAGFVHTSKVAFGSAVIDCSVSGNCTISSDGTQITVQSPQEDPSDESQPNVDVTVTNGAGDTSLVSRADKFTYT